MGLKHGRAHVPVPVFALAFLALCLLNSTLAVAPAVAPLYPSVKTVLVEASSWGLLIAIGALGLGTSASALSALGIRHIITVVGATVVIAVIVTGGLLAVGLLYH